MVVSSDDIGEHITPAIYDECRRRGYGAVFLDSENTDIEHIRAIDEVSTALTRRSITVFCPLHISKHCSNTVPVANCAVSGGNLQEYISELKSNHKRIALSIPRCRTEFDMPITKNTGRNLQKRELLQIIDTYDVSAYYSRRLITNYFIYSPKKDIVRYVLFDNARTISEKLKMAKKLGISDVFLIWKEISDISGDIVF